MATAKTGTFYLTETVTLPAAAPNGTIAQATIDLGAYVNVPTGQCVAVTGVDFIVQTGTNFSPDVAQMLSANGSLSMQLTDLNPGTLNVRADNQSLIASGGLNIDIANNIATHTQDLYPDEFGPTNLNQAYMVVNDSMFLTGGVFGANIGGTDVLITARVSCQVVKLSQKNWMSIAIQATADQ